MIIIRRDIEESSVVSITFQSARTIQEKTLAIMVEMVTNDKLSKPFRADVPRTMPTPPQIEPVISMSTIPIDEATPYSKIKPSYEYRIRWEEIAFYG